MGSLLFIHVCSSGATFALPCGRSDRLSEEIRVIFRSSTTSSRHIQASLLSLLSITMPRIMLVMQLCQQFHYDLCCMQRCVSLKIQAKKQ